MTQRHKYYLALIIAVIVYIFGTLLGPLGPNRFNLTPAKTHLLQLSIALPAIFIWVAAVYGGERLKTYASGIRKYNDGKALNKFATGLLILAFSSLIGGIYGMLRAWAMKDGWLSPFTILANYLAVILPLIAFSYLYTGSRSLKLLTKKKVSNERYWVIAISLFLLAVALIYLQHLSNYKYVGSTPDPTRYSSFYMSRPMVVITIIIPYLVSWWLGLMAALNLAVYRWRVKGVVYRASLFRLVVGTAIVVMTSIFVELFIALSTYIAGAGLGAILGLVYALLLVYAAGFLLIASGARKMMALEKVG
jgi:MFS family permease